MKHDAYGPEPVPDLYDLAQPVIANRDAARYAEKDDVEFEDVLGPGIINAKPEEEKPKSIKRLREPNEKLVEVTEEVPLPMHPPIRKLPG